MPREHQTIRFVEGADTTRSLPPTAEAVTVAEAWSVTVAASMVVIVVVKSAVAVAVIVVAVRGT